MPSRQLIGNNNYNNSKLKISKSLSSVHMIFLEGLLLKRWKLILLLSLELIAITFFWLPNNCFLLRVFIYDVNRNLKNVLYDTSLFFLQLFAFLHDVLILHSLLLSFKGSFIDDINHTSQVGTQLYMSPEQVININKWGLPSSIFYNTHKQYNYYLFTEQQDCGTQSKATILQNLRPFETMIVFILQRTTVVY